MEIYTTKEVSEMLKVTRQAVNQWIRERKLKAKITSLGYEIKEEELKKFIEKYRSGK